MTDNMSVVFAGTRHGLWANRRLLVVIWLFCLTQFPVDSDAKCLQDKEVFPKRHFYYNASSLPIVIETSDRSSHQLVSRILRILLLEVVGYAKVELRNGSNSMQTSEVLDHLSGRERVPQAMINLEVWLPAGFNIEDQTSQRNLVNGGSLGPSGRFGWFLPTSMIEEVWNKSSIAIDHWRSLRLTEVTSQFALADYIDLLQNVLTRTSQDSNESFCDTITDECYNGLYYPPNQHCDRLQGQCAILIASTPDLDGVRLLYQIDKLQLNVAVAWIGNHFHSFVKQQTARNIPVLFFNWTPNDLTSSHNYSRICFPTCQTTRAMSENCDFELHQLTKLMWAVIQSHTPEAYHIVKQMEFSEEELNRLLMQFSEQMEQSEAEREEVLEEVACQWVQSHTNIWERWLPDRLSSKTPIYLGGMIPLTGPYFRSPGVLPGAVVAVDVINRDPGILPDHELQLLVQDTKCMVDVAMTQFLKLVTNRTQRVAGIIGPACSETVEAVAGVSKHFNTIVISYSSEVHNVRNREQYPLLLSTVPRFLQYRDIYVEIFKWFHWKQVSLLAEDVANFPESHSHLMDSFLSNSIQVPYERKLPRNSSLQDVEKYVEELQRRDTKVIILASYERMARKVICAAFKKGMTARNGYVWFLPGWFAKHWWEVNEAEKVPCSDEDMQAVLQSHLLFVVSFLGPMESKIVGNTTVKTWFDNYSQMMDMLRPWPPSDFASYTYDAVFVFALGLHQLLSEDPPALESLHTDKTVNKFMHILRNLNFNGASGLVKFSGAERTGTAVNIIQYVGNDDFVQVGHFLLDKVSTTDQLYLNDSLMRWMTKDGLVPSDGQPEPNVCSIESFRRRLNVECDAAIAVASTIGITLFLVVMIICLIVVKKRRHN